MRVLGRSPLLFCPFGSSLIKKLFETFSQSLQTHHVRAVWRKPSHGTRLHTFRTALARGESAHSCWCVARHRSKPLPSPEAHLHPTLRAAPLQGAAFEPLQARTTQHTPRGQLGSLKNHRTQVCLSNTHPARWVKTTRPRAAPRDPRRATLWVTFPSVPGTGALRPLFHGFVGARFTRKVTSHVAPGPPPPTMNMHVLVPRTPSAPKSWGARPTEAVTPRRGRAPDEKRRQGRLHVGFFKTFYKFQVTRLNFQRRQFNVTSI